MTEMFVIAGCFSYRLLTIYQLAVLDNATADRRAVVIRSHWWKFTTTSLMAATLPAAAASRQRRIPGWAVWCWYRVPFTLPVRTQAWLDELTMPSHVVE